jgi:hypothetical protein
MILKGWRRTWPGSIRSAEREDEQCAAPERAARVYSPPPLKLWRGPQALHKVFGRSGTLCRPLRCKGRCRNPAPTEAVGPLHRTACMPSCSSGLPLRIGTMAVTPSVAALLTPETRCCRARDRADVLSGVRRVLLARARPSASVRSVTPLAAMGCCSPLSAVGLARLTRIRAPLSIGQHSPAHAPRGRASNAGASTSCIDPTHRQGIAPSLLGTPRPLASSPLGCRRASGGRRSARTGTSPLVPRSTVPRCAPQSRGEEIHLSASKER